MATFARFHIDSIRLSTIALVLAPVGMTIAPAEPAAAQQATAGEPSKALFIGAVIGDDVYVRSGAGESYYPFFKVHRGDLVKVTGEKYGFVSVSLVGPAFEESYGYIKQAKSESARIRLAADGRTATTLGRVDVIAPNLDAGNRPTDSWKVLARLEADKPLTVLETTDIDQDVVYKIALPAEATGWINAQFAPRAGAEDAEMFENMLAGKAAPPTPTTPDKAPSAADATLENNTTAQGAPSAGAPPVGSSAAPPATDGAAELVAQVPPAPPSDLVAMTPAEPATQPEKPRDPTWEDLEKAFGQLQKEPQESAELTPMRDMYAALADRHPDDRRIQSFTATRIKQLDIWQELQQKRLEVIGATQRMRLSGEEAEAVRAALERSAEYTAVGRVAASTIYDGTNLPKLFRLQDPATGRTVAYLKPDADYTLANRIDVIVGIVGDKTYDESMRLNMITPRRIDVLSPDKGAVTNVAGAPEIDDK